MNFIELIDEKIFCLNIKSYSIQTQLNNEANEIYINFDSSYEISKYFIKWQQEMIFKSLILLTENKYVLLKLAKPINLNTNILGFVSSGKIKFNTLENITRCVKILNVIN